VDGKTARQITATAALTWRRTFWVYVATRERRRLYADTDDAQLKRHFFTAVSQVDLRNLLMK